MKGKNLLLLKEYGFLVPEFLAVKEGEDFDLSFTRAETFAVRSSVAMEDGEESAHAGRFTTFLSVPRGEVKEAVARCFSEARNSLLETGQESEIEVLVQRMIPSVLSGVFFTANPQGILNEAVFVVGKGTGDGVVENKVPVTTYYYNTTDQIYYFEQQEGAPVFSEAVFQKLVELVSGIQDAFGQEMDVEFAIYEEKVFLLQARPITTLQKGSAPVVFDNSNIIESYPGISLPATQSFADSVYNRVFDSLMLRLTDEQPPLSPMLGVANGRIYYRISSWYDVLLYLPFHKKIIPLWQEMLGVKTKTITSSLEGVIPSRVRRKVLLRFLKFLKTTPELMEDFHEEFRKLLPAYEARLEETADSAALFRLYKEIEDTLSKKWDVTLINDMYTFVFSALAKKWHGQALAEVKNLESMKPVAAMSRLADIYREKGVDSDIFQKAFGAYQKDYGDRCPGELKMETRTFRTNPERLLQKIIELNDNPTPPGQKTQTQKSRTVRGFFARRAATGICNRELSRLDRTRIFGLMREILLKIGKNFTDEGLLDDPWDIFYLYFHELQETITNPEKKQLFIEQRKETYRRFERLPAYSRLVFAKEPFDKKPMNAGVGYTQAEGIFNGMLEGVPCSAGTITGEAVVAKEVSDCAWGSLEGKILVCESTDPGWAFLIAKASGVISERGSLLSHTAIITRELKKPSVVAVAGACKNIHTGDVLCLNGTTGTIKIVKRQENTVHETDL